MQHLLVEPAEALDEGRLGVWDRHGGSVGPQVGGHRRPRHLVEPERLGAVRGVPAEVGGVPRRVLSRRGHVVGNALEPLQQVGERVAEPGGRLDQVVARPDHEGLAEGEVDALVPSSGAAG